MKKLIAAGFLSVFTALASMPSLADELTPAKSADIHKLMEVTGALRIGQAMSQTIVAQITQNLKAKQPPLPQEAFDIVAQEVPKVISSEMTAKGGYVDQMVLVFDKHLTHDEIKGLLTFYSTPLGKKAISVMPMMAQEGMTIAQKWARTVGPKLDQRLKARFKERNIVLDAPKPAESAPKK